MNVKMQQIFNAIDGMRQLSAAKLPGSVSLAVIRLSKQMDAAIADCNAARKKLVEDMGLSVDDKGTIKFDTKEQADMFIDQFNGIMNEETELTGAKIPFSKIESVDISPNGLSSIEFVLDLDK